MYILCTLVFSLPIFYCESIIGRRTGRSSIGAMRQLAPGSRWTLIGVFTVLGPLMITSFYSVVGGWSIAYLLRSCFSSFGAMSHEEIGSLFANFTGSVWGPVLAHTAFLLISAIILAVGIAAGVVSIDSALEALKLTFGPKKEHLLPINRQAMEKGAEAVR